MDNTESYIGGLIIIGVLVFCIFNLLKTRYEKDCELTGKREEFD